MRFPKIVIEFKDADKMRYPSAGDYFMRRGKMVYQVIKMKKMGYMLAILIHEIVEYFLCIRDGILEDDITKFDIMFNEEQELGMHPDNAEPGDSYDAPYREQHQRATHVERAVIAAFDLSWEEYDKAIQRSLK